jgi:hypothetical protein
MSRGDIRAQCLEQAARSSGKERSLKWMASDQGCRASVWRISSRRAAYLRGLEIVGQFALEGFAVNVMSGVWAVSIFDDEKEVVIKRVKALWGRSI